MQNLTVSRATWDDVIALAKRQGVVTPGDVIALGLAPENLNKLSKIGLLVRSGRGIFEHPEFDWTEKHSYVQVARAVPNAVMCLLTALNIHEIGTQLPHQVWIAIPRGQRPPKARGTNLRVVTMTDTAYELGVGIKEFEGIEVKVYSAAKTIVDCFRLRRLVGHDVGLEALKDAMRRRLFTVDELRGTAMALRKWTTMQPYVDAFLT